MIPAWHAVWTPSRGDAGWQERREGIMKRNTRYAFVDRFGTVRSDLEADGMTLREIAQHLNPEADDPLINPWRWTYRTAIRKALGH